MYSYRIPGLQKCGCHIANIPTGIHFQLREVNYGNNSIVNITDIGSSNNESLLCITDKTDCCENPNRMGEWYFPDMSMVRVNGSGDSFFRDRGPSVVRLHRRHNVMMPTGDFYCEVPDANGVNQRIYIRVEAMDSPTVLMTTRTTASPNSTENSSISSNMTEFLITTLSPTEADIAPTLFQSSEIPIIPVAAGVAAVVVILFTIFTLICIILLR